MVQTLKRGNPIARKDHKCNFCFCNIGVGDQYSYSVNIFDGDFFTWKSHKRCNEIASKLNMYDNCDDGLSGEDFMENIRNEYMDLQSKYNTEQYESDDFEYPNFKGQLDFVCDFHLTNK